MPQTALGIPDRSNYGDLTTLPAGAVVTLVRQLHNAHRAGLHEDMRIGTPQGLFSWAVPKQMPQDATKRLAVRTPLHAWNYKDYRGEIVKGYGKGDVTKMEESPVVILKSSPNHVMFTRGDSKDAPIYNLVRTRNQNWLLSIRQPSQPSIIKSYPKEHFKSVPIDKVPELIATGATVVPKLDGAGTLLYLGDHGVEAYGIRTGTNGLKPEYTDYIPGLRTTVVPDELKGTVLRGELVGMHGNKVIPPNQLSGILNSNLRNAMWRQQGDGIKLIVAALAINQKGKDVYDDKKVLDVVNKLNSNNIVTLPSYKGREAAKLLSQIRKGNYPATNEGVVVHPRVGRPIKAKFKDDYDVVIRNIFKANTNADNRAGGFGYSIPGSDDIAGKVGSGFDQKLLRDMLKNQDKYIGRTARVEAQEQYPTGALRSPRFISLKDD